MTDGGVLYYSSYAFGVGRVLSTTYTNAMQATDRRRRRQPNSLLQEDAALQHVMQ